MEAIQAEGDVPLVEALASLRRKDYFTPRPRPWKLGVRNRGHGHVDYGVLDCFDDSVVENLERADAELIVAAVNAYKP